MSNFAWANPSTGIREQSNSKDEARLLVWKELQEVSPGPEEAKVNVIVYEQERAGVIGENSQTFDDPAETFDRFSSWESYAWADPRDGRRVMAQSRGIAVQTIQIELGLLDHAPVDSVALYRQRKAFTVDWNDARPADPAPAEIPIDTPSSLIEQVMEGTCADLNRASLLASLWIAQSLQEVAGALHYMSPGPPRRPGIFARTAAWWKKTFTFGKVSICEVCKGPLANPDGKICPNCAGELLKTMVREQPEAPPETPEQASERRWKETPHGYSPATFAIDTSKCVFCGMPEDHAIHGYTGD
jgi:hypothetical protein